MKAPLMYNYTPTEAAAELDHSLRGHYRCLGYITDCVGLSCSDCALNNPHRDATVGSVALKIVIAETYVSKHAQAQPDQYTDLKDILPLLKPRGTTNG